MKKKKKNGFSLMEVLIFITLISLIFVAMTYISVSSISSSKFAERKILATHYAEELREWLRGEKEKDWINFDKTGTYCFNTSPIPNCSTTVKLCATSIDDCRLSYALGAAPNANTFKRYVVLTYYSTGSDGQGPRVNANIKVMWKEGANIYQVTNDTVFSLWE